MGERILMQSEAAEPRVVAVVVAYNRRELLSEALDALAAQQRPVDRVVVVDNASSDDSVVVAHEHPIGADVVELPRNTGGAGGFAVGLAHALQTHGADLVWLMDDDTIPTPSALAELLAARESYPGPVALLGSRVVWHDGRDHPMNTPRLRPGASGESIARARAAGALPVRSSSFVSMMVDARAVRHHGLPVADYFIWNDDFEFSCRLLRRGVGLFVPGSVVEHRTRTFGSTAIDPGERFYFEVRNKLWLFVWSRALAPEEKVLYGAATLRRWLVTIGRSSQRRVLWATGFRGLRHGLLTRPRSTPAILGDLGEASREVTAVHVRSRRGA